MIAPTTHVLIMDSVSTELALSCASAQRIQLGHCASRRFTNRVKIMLAKTVLYALQSTTRMNVGAIKDLPGNFVNWMWMNVLLVRSREFWYKK
jgi:hypothetical protein